jgi:hypothetical protein
MTFKSGESGNMKGRPKGSGHRQRLFRELIAPHQETLITTALNLALSGNESMLRLFLDKLMPHNALGVPLTIQGHDAHEKINSLIENVANGDLKPDDAVKIASIIHKSAEMENQKKMILKLDSFEKQLAEANNRNISF